MRSSPRCVFDTNVLIRTLLFDQSMPAQTFFFALDAGEVLVSADTIAELNAVLGRAKVTQYVSEKERARCLQSLLREARLVEVSEKFRFCRDPNDDNFPVLTVNGEADCIMSGDDDPASLDPFRGIPILAPDRFLDALPEDRLEEKWHTPARIALAEETKEGQRHSTHSAYLGYAPGVLPVREAAP